SRAFSHWSRVPVMCLVIVHCSFVSCASVRPWDGCDRASLVDHSPDGSAPLRRREINLSQGTEWKALIRMYINTIPLSGDASCTAAQNRSWGPLPRTPVMSAMMANVGAAPRHIQSAAPRAAGTGHASRVPIVYVGMGFNSFRRVA